jgi:hypothetical protein
MFIEDKENNMSKWTHFLGVIRFDSFNLNVRPEPPQKDKLVSIEVNAIHKLFQSIMEPRGSEGPIQYETILTNRGPTVIITGDLRDFGYEDLNKIVEWLNDLLEIIREYFDKNKWIVFIRDAIINCDVEYHDDKLIIELDNKHEVFILNTYNKK